MQQQHQEAPPEPSISIAFRGTELQLALPRDAVFAALLQQLQEQLSDSSSSGQQLAAQTLKLLLPSNTGHSSFLPVQQLAADGASLASQGVLPGMRCVLLGSFLHELEAVASAEAAHAALRLPTFEHEAARHAQRASGGAHSSSTSSGGRHFFGSFRELPAHPGAPPGAPPPEAALALLHTLARDPGIVAVMQANSWRVGVLSEMPPEGLVGVSAVCILGFNHNRGAEIALRLRTDDLAGFRKHRAIRQTLVHELAHMVHDEHDASFKALNSSLLRQVEAAEEAQRGQTLAGGPVFMPPPLAAASGSQQEQQQQRPRTLGGPAGSSATPLSQQMPGARQTAGVAALSRWQQRQQQEPQHHQQQQQQPLASDGRTVPEQVVAAQQDDGGGFSGESLQRYEHDDPRTAAAEEVVRQLEGLTCSCKTEVAASAPAAAAAAETHQRHPSSTQLEQQQQQQQQPKQQPDSMQPDDTAAAPAGGSGPSTTSLPSSVSADGPQQQQQQPGSVSAAQQQQPQPAADDDVMQDAGWGQDDVVAAKLRSARTLLQQLQQEAGGAGQQATEALQTLASVLRRLTTSSPPEARFRRLRLSNAAFSHKLGRFGAARELLCLAGFEKRREQGGDEQVLLHVRDDPGLLWLVLSLTLEQLEQQHLEQQQ